MKSWWSLSKSVVWLIALCQCQFCLTIGTIRLTFHIEGSILFYIKAFIYLFLERGKEGRKRGRETSVSCLLHKPQPRNKPITQACALTGNRTRRLLLCSMMPNPPSHTDQGSIFFNPYNNPMMQAKFPMWIPWIEKNIGAQGGWMACAHSTN